MPLPPAPHPPKSPWQRLYGAAHAARRRRWADRAARLPRPVVSVGNLHWGGAGKTPLVAAVARHLRDRPDGGLRVAILSRGHGRSEPGRVRTVSTGEGPLLGPAAAGDEPVLLAGELPGVAVVVGADRHAAGCHALAHLAPPPDVFILDDGFSHVRLARDADLLVFPAADPWAGGRLPPGGRLREPLASAAWADAALLTGPVAPGEAHEAARRLARELAPYGFRGPAFAAPTRFWPPLWAAGGGAAAGEPLPPGSRVLLVSGVARPESFLRAVRGFEVTVTGELRFRDHHPYPDASLERIRRAFAEHGAEAVLTTAKDRVKLLGRMEPRLDLPLAELPLSAEPEPAFWDWLDERLGLAPAGGRPEGAGA
jgi:tetraacyldisaccharide 4'-kinase